MSTPTIRELVATCLCAATRVAVGLTIRFLPYSFWRPLLQRSLLPPVLRSPNDSTRLELVVRCIVRTDRWVPIGRCLERSLTAWILLHRAVPCRLRFAAAWQSPGQPFGHACIEVDGRVVLGEPATPMAFLESTGGQRA